MTYVVQSRTFKYRHGNGVYLSDAPTLNQSNIAVLVSNRRVSIITAETIPIVETEWRNMYEG
jgi:hypothetical protein